MGDWTFFSNYGHVLVCLARDNKARLRDVAADVGITERAVQKIVKDLQTEGFITVRKPLTGQSPLTVLRGSDELAEGLAPDDHGVIG